jgi:hypothetical protein
LENLAHVKVHEIEAEADVKIRVRKFYKQKEQENKTISSVAWVVIVSDCLHKLIGIIYFEVSFFF